MVPVHNDKEQQKSAICEQVAQIILSAKLNFVLNCIERFSEHFFPNGFSESFIEIARHYSIVRAEMKEGLVRLASKFLVRSRVVVLFVIFVCKCILVNES